MRRFIIITVMLIMFFTTGVRLDFGDKIECPDWVEVLISEDKGSAIDMTHHPIYRIARTHVQHSDDGMTPPSAR